MKRKNNHNRGSFFRPFPSQWLADFDEVTLERLAIISEGTSLSDEQVLQLIDRQVKNPLFRLIFDAEGFGMPYTSCNIYRGCTHGCLYCIGPWVLNKEKAEYFSCAHYTENAISRLNKELNRLDADCSEILLSLFGDVYQPEEIKAGITRRVIAHLIKRNMGFRIITKGGMRAVRDFDLLAGYPRAVFGISLSFWNDEDAARWEPHAAGIDSRIKSLEIAVSRGIRTWLSIDPVIDTDQALEIIMELHPVVDEWNIGRMLHIKGRRPPPDWDLFRGQVTDLLESIGAPYRF